MGVMVKSHSLDSLFIVNNMVHVMLAHGILECVLPVPAHPTTGSFLVFQRRIVVDGVSPYTGRISFGTTS